MKYNLNRNYGKGKKLALTRPSPPGEGGSLALRSKGSLIRLPLPGGEGWGEGKLVSN